MSEETQTTEKQEPLRLKRMQSLTVSEEEEAGFLVAHRDWARYKKRLQERPKPKRWAGNVGWVFVGLAAQTVLTVVIWLVTGDTNKHAWVTPLLAFITIVCAAFGVVAFYFDRGLKDQEAQSIETFIEDIDALAEHFLSTKPGVR